MTGVAARLYHLLVMLILKRLNEPKLSKRCGKKTLDTFGKRRRLARDLDLIGEATEAALKLLNIEKVAGKDTDRGAPRARLFSVSRFEG
jgi:hypothetical protein